MINIPENIAILLMDRQKRPLSDEEDRQLKEWLATDPNEEQIISGLLEKCKSALLLPDINVEKSWKTLDGKITRTAGWRSWKLWCVRYAAAAVFIPLLFIGVWLYVQNKSQNIGNIPVEQSAIYPGSPRAELILAGGKSITLETETPKNITDRQGRFLGVDSSHTLVYTDNAAVGNEQHILRIPLGGEYRLILADGTKIWLNSGSELTFPARFTGRLRQVELKGEVFFAVTKDSLHPFEIKTPFSTVRVLGTSFNVCSYPEDGTERTTLVGGKVEIILPDRVCRLLPGRQLELNTADYNVSVKEVDTDIYSSWKDGIFRFSDMPLEELTVKLHRWYNAEFFFLQPECKKVRFTGAIRKYADFQEFMKLIETTTNIRVTINEGSVVIGKK